MPCRIGCKQELFAMSDQMDARLGNASPKIIQDPREVPLVLHSDVRAPLASLSFLRRSLALAELAVIDLVIPAENDNQPATTDHGQAPPMKTRMDKSDRALSPRDLHQSGNTT